MITIYYINSAIGEIKLDYNNMKEAVIKQLNMSEEDTKQTLKDVINGGAAGGFSGFIYHYETVKFAKDNIKAIYGSAKEQAQDLGEDVYKMIQGFNCLKDMSPLISEIADTIHGYPDKATVTDGMDTQILNALAWYALEEVAHRETEDA